MVTRETAAGTFSLVCTSVRAVSEGGAEQRDGMPALMGQYHQKFDFWPKRRSLPRYHGLVQLEGLRSLSFGFRLLFEARRAAKKVLLLTS